MTETSGLPNSTLNSGSNGADPVDRLPDSGPQYRRQSRPRSTSCRFRIRQDFADTAAVKSELTEVAVGKPGKQEFIRVHPSPDYRLDAAIVEYERTDYLVVPELANSALRDQVTAVTLFTVQNTQKVTYLWPVKILQGRPPQISWTDSARASWR